MTMRKDIYLSEADLNFEELEKLASELHYALTEDAPVTLNDYIHLAKTVTSRQLGYRNVKAIQLEPRLMAYFPDEVMNILSKRDFSNVKFNEHDNEFLIVNKMRGNKWIARHFYTNANTIQRRAKSLHVRIKSHNHPYTKAEDSFILKHLNESWVWIGKQLNLTDDSVRKRANVLVSSRISKKPSQHIYTDEENMFIKRNKRKGWKWIAQQLKISTPALSSHANKTLKLKARK